MLEDDAVVTLVGQVLAHWRREGEPERGYGADNPGCVAEYDSDDKIIGLRAFYRHTLLTLIPRFAGSRGCDLGCGLGISSLLQWSLGAAEVYGCDINPRHAATAQAWRAVLDTPGLHFLPIDRGALPLQSRSVDWVIANQVLCNVSPEGFLASMAEARRILRPDGVLIVCDSNNPYCGAVVERLTAEFHRAEVGTAEREGYHTLARKEMLLQGCPALDEAAATRLARETCYMWGDALAAAAQRYLATGETPGQFFRPGIEKSPCNPRTGHTIGNVTDPFVMARDLESLGFRTHIAVDPTLAPRGSAALHRQLATSQGFFVIGFPERCRQ